MPPTAALPLNVLMVLSDQHLATCMGVEGHPQVITPQMDRLAREGVRFRGAYAANPICTPSRVSVLCGQYPHNHGYYGLSGPRPARLPSFLGHFRGAGYRTAAIGTVHTPNDPRNWLEGHVDEFLDYGESIDGKPYETPLYEGLKALGRFEEEDNRYFEVHHETALEGFPSALPFELSMEGWAAKETMRFIDESASQQRPFCLQVAFQRPHQPFTPDKRFWDMYPEDLALPATLMQDPSGRPPHFQSVYKWFREMKWALEPRDFESGVRRLWRGYLACITHVDHALGLILEHLDRAGLAGNTIVVYSADHGAYSGTHGLPEKAPGICSEAVCRVPLIWRPPPPPEAMATRQGSVVETLVSAVDIAPTLAALCGLPPMDWVDGRDLTPLLSGGSDPGRSEVVVTEHPWSKALRWKNWRFVHYQPEMFPGKDVGELYDLSADPDEAGNLYHDAACRDIVHQCRRLLVEWLIRTTRIVTAWPVQTTPGNIHYPYPIAGDGKEANTEGAAGRAKRGQLFYL